MFEPKVSHNKTMAYTLSPRSRRIAWVIGTLVGLWLILCAVVGLWLPGKAKQMALDWADAHHQHLSIERIAINPFSWTVRVEGVVLAGGKGGELFTAQSLMVKASPLSLVRGRYRLAAIELVAPHVTLARDDKAAPWNWQTFIDALHSNEPRPAPQAPGKPPRVMLDHIAIENGRIEVDDGAEKAPAWRLDPVNIELNDLSTEPVEGGYTLNAQLDDGARLSWHGDIELLPFSSKGQLRLDGLTVKRVWPIVGSTLKLKPESGALAASVDYDARYDQSFALQLNRFDAKLTDLKVVVDGSQSAFSLPLLHIGAGALDMAKHEVKVGEVALEDGRLSARRDPAMDIDWAKAISSDAKEAPAPEKAKPEAEARKPGAWQVKVEDIAVKRWNVSFIDDGVRRPAHLSADIPDFHLALGLGKDGLALERIHGAVSAITLKDRDSKVASVGKVALAPTTVNLDAHRVTMGKLGIDDVAVALNRDAAGTIDLVSMFAPLRDKPKPPSPHWDVEWPEVDLAHSSVQWHDAAAPAPATIALTDLHGAVLHGKAGRLNASLKGLLGKTAPIALDGEIEPATSTVQAKLALDKAPLALVAPYMLGKSRLTLRGGTLSTQLNFASSESKPWQLQGTADVANFAILEPGVAEPLIGWKNLALDGLQVGSKPLAVNVDRVRIDTPVIRLALDEKRNLNMTRAFAPKTADNQPVAPAPAPAAQPAAKSTLTANVRTIAVRGGELDFADRSMTPGFATRVHDLAGTVAGISTDPTHHTIITLDGQVDSFGSAKVRGTVAPLAVTDDSVVLLSFLNIPISSLNPYSETFAGWRIDDGRLNVDLRYGLKNKALDGQNKIVIQSIKLGEEVDRPGVKRLPLRLAVALLEDGDGRIDLDLPVSGRLDDPKFSYGHLVAQAIETVITKIVTSPFRALATAFGHEGFDEIDFAAGRAGIAPPEREKLAKLATQMAKRPRLTVTLAGTYDPKIDLHSLARSRVDTEIMTGAGLPPDPDLPVSRPDMDDAATRAATRNLYGSRIGKLALASKLLSTKDDKARYDGFRDELIAAEMKTVGNTELLKLASDRANAAKAQLVTTAPELAARVTLAAPKAVESGKAGIPIDITLDATGAPAAAPAPAAQ